MLSFPQGVFIDSSAILNSSLPMAKGDALSHAGFSDKLVDAVQAKYSEISRLLSAAADTPGTTIQLANLPARPSGRNLM